MQIPCCLTYLKTTSTYCKFNFQIMLTYAAKDNIIIMDDYNLLYFRDEILAKNSPDAKKKK